MSVVVTGIVPQPRIDLRSQEFETGTPVRVTTYRGVVVIEPQQAGAFRPSQLPETNPVSFFLPDSLPYPPGTEAVVSATAASALQPARSGTSRTEGPYGLHSLTAQLVDDPGGSGARWVAVSFVNTYASRRTEVSYEVIVVVPAGES